MSKPYELVNFCEIDKYAAKSYCAVHDVDPGKILAILLRWTKTNCRSLTAFSGVRLVRILALLAKVLAPCGNAVSVDMSTILSQYIGLNGISVLSAGVTSLTRRAHLCL